MTMLRGDGNDEWFFVTRLSAAKNSDSERA
jgi:hypothetical protein